jgi:hypothetical protein
MHRSILDSADAVAFALVFMVTNQCAYGSQWVVFEQHPSRIVQPPFLQQADHFRNVGMDRAALLAAGFFALQATVGFFHYVQRHIFLLRRVLPEIVTDSVRTGAAFRFVGIRLLSVFQL